jgi:hypothetical protein
MTEGTRVPMDESMDHSCAERGGRGRDRTMEVDQEIQYEIKEMLWTDKRKTEYITI